MRKANPGMDTRLELGELEQSAVAELANIGLGHATTALSEITGRPLHMSIPYADSMKLEEIPLRLGEAEGLTVGIMMPIEGEAEGHIMFLTDWAGACQIWRFTIGSAPSGLAAIGDLEASAMLEIGNIINSSFLAAIADTTGLQIHSTPPYMAVDMAACILESVVVEASLDEHYALAIRTEIRDDGEAFEGFFLYIPTLEGLREAFRRLGLPEAA
jgi:chemotaxis protein CheC